MNYIENYIEKVLEYRKRQSSVITFTEVVASKMFQKYPERVKNLVKQFWQFEEMADHGYNSRYGKDMEKDLMSILKLNSEQANSFMTAYLLSSQQEKSKIKNHLLNGTVQVGEKVQLSQEFKGISTSKIGKDIIDGQSCSTYNFSCGDVSPITMAQYLAGINTTKRDRLSDILKSFTKQKKNGNESELEKQLATDLVPFLLSQQEVDQRNNCSKDFFDGIEELKKHHNVQKLKRIAETFTWLYSTSEPSEQEKICRALFPEKEREMNKKIFASTYFHTDGTVCTC